MKKKLVWKVILIIAIIGCICGIGFMGWYFYQDYQAQKEYERLQQMTAEPTEEPVTLEEIKAQEFTGERDGEAAKLPDDIFLDMDNPINFKELVSINPDIYAWIRIPDTMIDYPILQRAGDDAFYLHHDMYGQPRFAGSIYTEDCNAKDFSDPNTLIYGHNMKNKSMFQNLHLFRDEAFFNDNPYVYIYMPDRVLVYKVFAAYVYDDRHIMNSFDFDDPVVYEQYLTDIFAVRSMEKHLREDVEVSVDDTIITLSTCIGGYTNSRYLVQAVLIKDEASVPVN